MKFLTVLGTRPELIKMSPVIRACEAAGIEHVLVHTGQHYSYELDEVIRTDLGLTPPEHHLSIGSKSDAEQIAAIIAQVSKIILLERPDVVIVQGDTNSALGGALAANKTGTALAHVEAGLRSYDRTMPEEVNRRLIDHIADHLLAPTALARDTLLTEGIGGGRIAMCGNTVVDELERFHSEIPQADLLAKHDLRRRRFGIATIHRRENVRNEERLRSIFVGLQRVARELDFPIVAALHPNTAHRLRELKIEVDASRVRLIPPLGYREFLALHANAALLLTDSGGLQEEACCLGVPCVTLRDNTERPESIQVGASLLAGANPDDISRRAHEMHRRPRTWDNPFGDGRAGARIVRFLAEHATSRNESALAARPAALRRTR